MALEDAQPEVQTPQERIAHMFMEHKGLGDLEPIGQERVEGEPCWYFTYEVDGSRLELEVAYDDERGWETAVTSFSALTD